MPIIIDSLGRRWDSDKHPRDRKGRFIRTAHKVRLFDVGGTIPWGVGRVTKINDEGHIDVEVTALARNSPSSAEHRVGERLSMSAGNLESVDEKASIDSAEAASDPNNDAAADKVGATKQGVFRRLIGALAQSRTNAVPDSNGAISKSDTDRSRDKDSLDGFASALTAAGIDPQSADENAPDGLPSLQPVIDKENEENPLPNGWKEILPETLDREFEGPDGTRRGVALIGDDDNPQYFESTDDGQTYTPFEASSLDDLFTGDGNEEEPKATIPDAETTSTERPTEDDFLADLEAIYDDGESVVDEGGTEGLPAGYYVSREEDSNSSTVFDKDDDEVTTIPNEADNERLQQAAAKIYEHYNENNPESEESDSEVPTSEATPEVPTSEDIPEEPTQEVPPADETSAASPTDRLNDTSLEAQDAFLSDDAVDNGKIFKSEYSEKAISELEDAGLIEDSGDGESYILTDDGLEALENEIGTNVSLPEREQNEGDDHVPDTPAEPDAGDGGDEPPSDELTPDEEEQLTSLFSDYHEVQTGQIPEELESLEEKGLVDIDRRLYNDDGDFEEWSATLTDEGKTKKDEINRRDNNLPALSPDQLTDEELASEIERLEAGPVNDNNRSTSGLARARDFKLLNEQRKRSGDDPLTLDEFRSRLDGAPDVPEESTNVSPAAGNWLHGLYGQTVDTEGGFTTINEDQFNHPETQELIDAGFISVGEPSAFNGRRAVQITPDGIDYVDNGDFDSTVPSEASGLRTPSATPRAEDLNKSVDELRAELERVRTSPRSDRGDGGQAARTSRMAEIRAAIAQLQREEPDTEPGTEDLTPEPEAPNPDETQPETSVVDAVDRLNESSSQGDIDAALHLVSDEESGGAAEQTTLQRLDDISENTSQRLSDVMARYNEIRQERRTNSNERPIAITQNGESLYEGTTVSWDSGEGEATGTVVGQDPQTQLIKIQLNSDGTFHDVNPDDLQVIDNETDADRAARSSGNEHRNDQRLDEINRELDEIRDQMRTARGDERNALREREDALDAEKDELEAGGATGYADLEEGLQAYTNAETDEERTLQVADILDILSATEDDQPPFRHENATQYTSNVGDRADAPLPPDSNPRDTNLLSRMRDEQGSYRLFEQGAERGEKFRVGDRVAVYFRSGNKRGYWVGTVVRNRDDSQAKVAIRFDDGGDPNGPNVPAGTVRNYNFDQILKVDNPDLASGEQNPNFTAPETLSNDEQLRHLISKYGYINNQGDFGYLNGSERLTLSNGYYLTAPETPDTTRRTPARLTLHAPDGTVIGDPIEIEGGQRRGESTTPGARGNPERYFSNLDEVISDISSRIDNDEPRDTPTPDVEDTTPEPSSPEAPPVTSEVSPADVANVNSSAPGYPSTDEINSAISASVPTKETNGVTHYDFSDHETGETFDLPSGYKGRVGDLGLELIGHDGENFGTILFENDNDFSAEDINLVAYTMIRDNLDERAMFANWESDGFSASGYLAPHDGFSRYRVGSPTIQRQLAVNAMDVLRDNPSLRVPLAGGWSAYRDGDNVTFVHEDASVPSISVGLDSPDDLNNHLGVLSLVPRLENPTTDTSGYRREVTDTVAALTSSDLSQFKPFQHINIGPLVLRRGRNNDWTLFSPQGGTITNVDDGLLTTNNRGIIEANLNSYVDHYSPRSVNNVSTEETSTPDVPQDSVEWDGTSDITPAHVVGEVQQAMNMDINDTVDLLNGDYTIKRTADGRYGDKNFSLTRNSDGLVFRMSVPSWQSNQVGAAANTISRKVNQIRSNDHWTDRVGIVPAEVWGTPDPDAAKRVGARVLDATTNRFGYVESLTPAGKTATVRYDDGTVSPIRTSALTGFTPEEIAPNSDKPIIPVGRSAAAVRAIGRIKNADKLEEWLTKSRLGDDTNNRALKKTIQDILDASYTDRLTGVRPVVTGASTSGGQASIRIAYVDVSSGREVGHHSLTIAKQRDKMVAYHAFMEIQGPYRDRKINTISNSALENWYRYNGVKEAGTSANIDVGTYAWGQMGFGWDPDNVRENTMNYFLDRIQLHSRFGDVSPEDQQTFTQWRDSVTRMWEAIRASGRSYATLEDFEQWNIPTPGDLGSFGRSVQWEDTRGGKTIRLHLGKDAMTNTGSSWPARAYLESIPLDDPLILGVPDPDTWQLLVPGAGPTA